MDWFIKIIEQTTIVYFERIYPNKKKSKTILHLTVKAKKVIPSTFRVADTFFTQMDIIEIGTKIMTLYLNKWTKNIL